MKNELLKLIHALEASQKTLINQNNALFLQNKAILAILNNLGLSSNNDVPSTMVNEEEYMNNLYLELKNKGIHIDLIEYSLGSSVKIGDLYNIIHPSKVVPINVFSRIIKPYLSLLHPDIIHTRKTDYRFIKNIKLKVDNQSCSRI